MKNDNTPAAPTIHRFTATPGALFKTRMQEGAEILDIVQGSKGIDFYALVDADKDKEWRHFLLIGTGMPIPFGWELHHLKTFRPNNGPALHLFGVPKDIAKKIGLKKFAEAVVE